MLAAIQRMESKVEGMSMMMDRLESKIEGVGVKIFDDMDHSVAKIDGRVGAKLVEIDGRVGAKLVAMDSKIDKVSAKIDNVTSIVENDYTPSKITARPVTQPGASPSDEIASLTSSDCVSKLD